MVAAMTDSTNAPTLADVLVRLDRLEGALHRLIDVASRAAAAPAQPQPAPAYQQQAYQPAPTYQQAPAYAPTAQAPRPAPGPKSTDAYSVAADAAYRRPDDGQPARAEPPIIEVAAPNMPGFGPPPSSGGSGSGSNPNEPRREYDPYGFRTDIEVPPPSATIQQVLAAVFDAGLRAEPEDTWAIMTKLTHASQMVGPRALDHFKAFAWHKLRRTASGYLRNNDPATFTIAYTDPAQPTPENDRVRVFVKAGDNRMPVPVAFARDASQAGAWRLTMISL